MNYTVIAYRASTWADNSSMQVFYTTNRESADRFLADLEMENQGLDALNLPGITYRTPWDISLLIDGVRVER